MNPLPVLLTTDSYGTHWHVYTRGRLSGHGTGWLVEWHHIGCHCQAPGVGL